MSPAKEALRVQPETRPSNTGKLDSMQVFSDLIALFKEKLWQEQNSLEIRQLIDNIVTTITPYLDNQHTFKCGSFHVQMDPNNEEHLFFDNNRKEVIRVTAVPHKNGLGIEISRAPYPQKKKSILSNFHW